MTHLHVLCLGEILFDCLADQPGIPLNQVQSWTIYPGGALANVACGLVKLGTPTALISTVGQDTERQNTGKTFARSGSRHYRHPAKF